MSWWSERKVHINDARPATKLEAESHGTPAADRQRNRGPEDSFDHVLNSLAEATAEQKTAKTDKNAATAEGRERKEASATPGRSAERGQRRASDSRGPTAPPDHARAPGEKVGHGRIRSRSQSDEVNPLASSQTTSEVEPSSVASPETTSEVEASSVSVDSPETTSGVETSSVAAMQDSRQAVNSGGELIPAAGSEPSLTVTQEGKQPSIGDRLEVVSFVDQESGAAAVADVRVGLNLEEQEGPARASFSFDPGSAEIESVTSLLAEFTKDGAPSSSVDGLLDNSFDASADLAQFQLPKAMPNAAEPEAPRTLEESEGRGHQRGAERNGSDAQSGPFLVQPIEGAHPGTPNEPVAIGNHGLDSQGHSPADGVFDQAAWDREPTFERVVAGRDSVPLADPPLKAQGVVTESAMPGTEFRDGLRMAGQEEVFAQNFGRTILSHILGDDQQFRIRLQPPSLGQMHVQMAMRGTSLDLFIEVESHAVRHLLHSRVNELQQTLAHSGIDMDQFKVEVTEYDPRKDSGGPRDQNQTASDRPQGQLAGRRDTAAEMEPLDGELGNLDGPAAAGTERTESRLIDTRA